MSNVTAFAEPLFRVKTTMPKYGRYKDVKFHWFYAEEEAKPRRQALYKVLIEDYDVKEKDIAYSEEAIEELFSADEAAALKAYLDAVRGDAAKTVIEPAELPIPNNSMGFLACGASWGGDGDCEDYYMLSEDSEYNLPFKVWGYFWVNDWVGEGHGG